MLIILKQAGTTSLDCEEAVAMTLQPPPYVKEHSFHRLLRRVIARKQSNASEIGMHTLGPTFDLPNAIILPVAILILLFISVFVFASFKGNRQKLRERVMLTAQADRESKAGDEHFLKGLPPPRLRPHRLKMSTSDRDDDRPRKGMNPYSYQEIDYHNDI